MKVYVVLLCLLVSGTAFPQSTCPPNIGFESGNFDHWQPYSGAITTSGVINVRPGSRTQTLNKNTGRPELDRFGHFPVVAPNGSLYSARIGDENSDNKAERMSYAFTVPATAEAYSIIFNYAVVLQNPGHQEYQQPRFTVRVFNETRNSYIECSSFDFVAGYNQPDFVRSDVDPTILYKPWSSATINLSSFRGEHLRLEFTVTDCTLGAHFGYAYFDVIEKCQNAVTGNIICPGTDRVTLQAPTGFAGYEWYTGNLNQNLGSGNQYTVNRPQVGDSIAVVLLPYDYLGCRDTLRTTIKSVADPIQLSVKDTLWGCSNTGLDLTSSAVTEGSSAALQFEYFTDSVAMHYVPNAQLVSTPGVYYIRATNPSGCVQTKPLTVLISPMPVFSAASPPETAYPKTVNLTALPDNPQLDYTYWEDEALTREVANPATVNQSGTYYIKGASQGDCMAVQAVSVKIKPVVFAPNAFTPNGDGRNDRFLFRAVGGLKTVAYFKVYNRWGLEVFSTKESGVGWDGTYKGQPLESGTYVWILKATDWLDNVYTAKGTVVLIR